MAGGTMGQSDPVEATISTDRLFFNCRIQGDTDGLPILLLHGNFGTSRWWLPLLRMLPTEIRAFAPDMRGSGKSEKPQNGYTIESQALDLASLVEALDLSEFALVAHGSGAAVAIEYALTNDVRLQSLVLVDPAPLDGVYTPPEAQTARGDAQQPLAFKTSSGLSNAHIC
jgi:branched-chain amino acid transport system permease protein